MEVKAIPVSDSIKHLVSPKFGPVSHDGWCGEPIYWGREIIVRPFSEEERKLLCREGSLEYTNHGLRRVLVFVQKKLTREDAIRVYGPQTDLQLGPRGGFQSITFGTKKFLQKELREGAAQ